MIKGEAIVRLEMSVAMHGEISPPLRAVFVSYGQANIHFDGYFDGEVSDDDRDSMSSVETELIAGHSPIHRITHTVRRIDCPQPLPREGFCAYARREPGERLKGDVAAVLERVAGSIEVMNGREIQRSATVRIAIQEAVIGGIGPQFRELGVLFGDTSIHLDCYFDGEISDEDRDSMARVKVELATAFPNNHRITHAVHRIDYPNHISIRESAWSLFGRREYIVEPHFTSSGERRG